MSTTLPEVGDWVSFYSPAKRRVLTGFILNIPKYTKVCMVYVPAEQRTMAVSLYDVTPADVSLQPEDLRALIDLSLDLKDEAWFRELMGRRRAHKQRDNLFLALFLTLASLLFVVI
ncbi:hypothetical protein GCM10010885_03460 [Alicyclobacillus cellulosilyticus]|uniref:IDEAL domain-containing protein n=1 Tax=Alicyclobacillus cellulosilyticus TaxID=1003997 RepID=A0A917K4K0_9BACL|nr:IDEAL domain-containing protein [Alicyclobacillus cellulosilyticus]GGI97218.1 hypothetical protein GCM10010885_03460 [Alicyclobacillus cellulosilyticus]